MPESHSVERIDDLLGDIGDFLRERALAIKQLLGAEGELALGLRRGPLEVELGKHLGQSPVEEDSGRERAGVQRSARAATRGLAAPTGTPTCTTPASNVSTRKVTTNPRILMKRAEVGEMEPAPQSLVRAPRTVS